MDRRTKATLHRDLATRLMAEWGVSVAQARYSDDGHWYALLHEFPAALVDANGYLLFPSEDAFRASPHLSLGKQISVRKPGISVVPGYVLKVQKELIPIVPDLDIHDLQGSEGRARLVAHLVRERDRRLVARKKASSQTLSCEVCGFCFASTYGVAAKEYCEVHHLEPLATATGQRRTSLGDLTLLCANGHRVVHLRNPPFTLEEVRAMIEDKNR